MKPRILYKTILAAACFALAGSAAAEITAKFAVTLPEKSHQGQGVARFVELVAQKSHNNIRIKPFYNAALGNDVQVTSALQGGTIEFTVPQTTTLTGMVKDFEILDYPFLFDSEKEAETVLDGQVGARLLDKLPAKGLIGLTYWENGFFNFTNSKRPLAKLEDFQGLKLRSIQAKISQETVKALGANPVPLAVPELYTALETRTVDGQGTPTAVIAALKLNEVQKYLSQTRHAYGAFIPLVSKKFWDKLSAADRKILVDSAVEARSYQRQVARAQARSAQEAMVAKGLLVNDIAPTERVRMRDRMKPVWGAFNKEVGEGISREVFAEIEKMRGK
ncbi:MAG TPA: DctP family TRAP transporter solute-binding subunit [Burkholderiaceae bacterium]|jgi:tripartite ATP-independent transporter DctP family solute receptor|nr:DctP family TRAP transporter solute-binding subunit [Burkholderiaceae bacterium]